jgi:aminomethyltransferase
MSQVETSTLQKTPLHARHVALGARMVPFGGWDMPVEYSGISDEHLTVRTRAGLFDVSHMGEIEVAGDDALAAVQRITSNDAAKLKVGQIQYSGLTTEQGAFVDDLLVYRLADAHFLLVVNAGNIAKDFAWISEQIKPAGDAVAVNSSSRYALIALQGPASREILQALTGVDLAAISTTGSRPVKWQASARRSHARVTPARTASRYSSRRSTPSARGTRSCRPASPPA